MALDGRSMRLGEASAAARRRERQHPCYLHASRPAVVACSACARPICATCAGEVQGVVTCPMCDAAVRRGRAFRRVLGATLGLGALCAGLFLLGTRVLFPSEYGQWQLERELPSLAEGDRALAEHAYELAEAAYARALERAPENALVQGRLGLALYLGGDREGARGLLEQATAAGVGDPRVREALGRLNAEERSRAQLARAEEARAQAAEQQARLAQALAARDAAAAEQARLRSARAQSEAALAEAAARAAKDEVARAEATSALRSLTDDAPADDTGCAVPLRHTGNALLVDVLLDGQPAVLLVDTGATASLLSEAYADRAGLSPVPGRLLQAHTVSGAVTLRLARVDRIEVGGRAVRGGEIGLCGDCGLQGADGLLGMDVMSALHIQLDVQAGLARFGECP